jgi:hypothetical protein
MELENLKNGKNPEEMVGGSLTDYYQFGEQKMELEYKIT